MWSQDYTQRLQAWADLRRQCTATPLAQTMTNIHIWWQRTPWQPYYLDWLDQPTWPDPWQLLNDNVYCDLARALGILYTISLLDRADLTDAALVLSQDGHNLVMVDKSKYILNWNPDTVVNTSQTIEIHRQLSQSQIKQQYN